MYNRILRLPRVIDKTGLPRTAIYNGMADGTFPKSIQLTQRAVGWIEKEIDDWVEKRIEKSRLYNYKKKR